MVKVVLMGEELGVGAGLEDRTWDQKRDFGC